MPRDDTRKAWDRFESEVQGLAGELRRQFRTKADDKVSAELDRSLDQLRQAAESVFKSLESASRDPEVRTKTRETARSFGSAIAETFRDLSEEIDRAVRKPKS